MSEEERGGNLYLFIISAPLRNPLFFFLDTERLSSALFYSAQVPIVCPFSVFIHSNNNAYIQLHAYYLNR